MSSLGTIIVCNIILIVVIAALAGLFVGAGSRGDGLAVGGFAFLWTGNLLLGLSITGWIIYVAVHFIQKFW